MWYLDNINVVRSEDSKKKKSATAYNEYFSVMALTAEQLRRRIKMAQELEDALFMLFLAWFYESDEDEAQERFIDKYLDTVEKYDDVGMQDDFVEYVVLLAALLHESTMENKDDPYYTSYDRATFVAANEANTALNKIEYGEAVQDGKTKKTWHTEQDLRVRPTHVPLDGTTVPIDQDFNVGGYPMAFAKDTSRAPMREYINCRCSTTYS